MLPPGCFPWRSPLTTSPPARGLCPGVLLGYVPRLLAPQVPSSTPSSLWGHRGMMGATALGMQSSGISLNSTC